jgi:ribosomal protein S12 methylthiotransferase accessory factor
MRREEIDGLARSLRTQVPKAFRDGTHRMAAPEATLTRFRPFASAMGITRIGNVTGLDRIGIPVTTAIRPNSRSVSVAQGKGPTLAQAMASALMEAAEGFHGERLDARFRYTSARTLRRQGRVVDTDALCRTEAPLDADTELSWIMSFDLLNDAPCFLPAEIVHTDCTVPASPGQLSRWLQRARRG